MGRWSGNFQAPRPCTQRSTQAVRDVVSGGGAVRFTDGLRKRGVSAQRKTQNERLGCDRPRRREIGSGRPGRDGTQVPRRAQRGHAETRRPGTCVGDATRNYSLR